MEISINKIKTVSKYSFFSLLYIFNLLSLYLFCLTFWRCRDLLNYYDPDYKGHLDIPEMFIGYTGGCGILFVLSFIYPLVYIRNKPLLAFLWLFLPVIYFIAMAYYDYKKMYIS